MPPFIVGAYRTSSVPTVRKMMREVSKILAESALLSLPSSPPPPKEGVGFLAKTSYTHALKPLFVLPGVCTDPLVNDCHASVLVLVHDGQRAFETNDLDTIQFELQGQVICTAKQMVPKLPTIYIQTATFYQCCRDDII